MDGVSCAGGSCYCTEHREKRGTALTACPLTAAGLACFIQCLTFSERLACPDNGATMAAVFNGVLGLLRTK
jgi:hypothetical protein